MVELAKDIDGKYEILERIREGGMGAIYKVRHRVLDQLRIIKTMRSRLKSDSVLRRRFETEARTASRLRHDNIAQLFDFALDDEGNAFMVLEFIDGYDLDEVLDSFGPPPVTLSIEIASQCLDALGYLHQRGIIHRDISPDNLMVTRDEENLPLVKLIDLGVAKVLRDQAHQTRQGTFLGKLRYASPEQLGFSAENPIDHRTDLYSFGVVLYELLTGMHPVRGDSAEALIAGHLTRPPVPFSETDPEKSVNAALREVVIRALAKDPKDRYPDAKEFCDAMIRAQPGIPHDLKVFHSWFALRDRKLSRTATAEFSSTQHRIDRQFEAVQEGRRRASGLRRPDSAGSRPESTSAEKARGKHEEEPESKRDLGQALEFQLNNILSNARAAAGNRRFDQAEMFLKSAKNLAPNDPEVLSTEEFVREARRRRREAIARVKEMARGIQRLERMIASGLLDEAEGALRQLRGSVGDSADLDRMLEKIRSKRGAMGNSVMVETPLPPSGMPPSEEPLDDAEGSVHQDVFELEEDPPRKRVFKSLLNGGADDGKSRKRPPSTRRFTPVNGASETVDEKTGERREGCAPNRHKTAPVPELFQDTVILERLIGEGKIQEANVVLKRLLLEKKPDVPLDRFRERIDTLRTRRIEEIVEEIEAALDASDMALARDKIEEGKELEPGNSRILEAERRLLRLEHNRTKLEEFRLLLDQGRLEEAGRVLKELGADLIEGSEWVVLQARYYWLVESGIVRASAESGRFEEALNQLRAIPDDHRDAVAFQELQAEIEESGRQDSLRKLLEDAVRHAGRFQYETAFAILDEAMELDPDDENTRRKLQELREEHHGYLVGLKVKEIEVIIRTGDFVGAATALDHAVITFGKDERFSALKDRIEVGRESALAVLSDRIDAELATGGLEGAVQLIEEASRLGVEESRMIEWKAAIENKRRSGELFHELSGLLDEGKLDEAGSLLKEHVSLASEQVFEPLRERVRIGKELEKAGRFIRNNQLDEASVVLEKLSPGGPQEELFLSLREELEGARKQESDRETCGRIREFVEAGDFQAGLRLLETLDPAQDTREMVQLRKQIMTLQKHWRIIEKEIEEARDSFTSGDVRKAGNSILRLKESESVQSTVKRTAHDEIFAEVCGVILEPFGKLMEHIDQALEAIRERNYSVAYDRLSRTSLIAPGDSVVEELFDTVGQELRRIAKEKRCQKKEQEGRIPEELSGLEESASRADACDKEQHPLIMETEQSIGGLSGSAPVESEMVVHSGEESCVDTGAGKGTGGASDRDEPSFPSSGIPGRPVGSSPVDPPLPEPPIPEPPLPKPPLPEPPLPESPILELPIPELPIPEPPLPKPPIPEPPLPEPPSSEPPPGMGSEEELEPDSPLDRELKERRVAVPQEESNYRMSLPGLLHDLVWPVQGLPFIDQPWDLCATPNDIKPVKVSATLSVGQALDLVSIAILWRALKCNMVSFPMCSAHLYGKFDFSSTVHVDVHLQVFPNFDDRRELSREERDMLRRLTRKTVIRVLGKLKKLCSESARFERSWPIEKVALRSGSGRPEILAFAFGGEPGRDSTSETGMPVNLDTEQALALEIDVKNTSSVFLLFPFGSSAELWTIDLPAAVAMLGA